MGGGVCNGWRERVMGGGAGILCGEIRDLSPASKTANTADPRPQAQTSPRETSRRTRAPANVSKTFFKIHTVGPIAYGVTCGLPDMLRAEPVPLATPSP